MARETVVPITRGLGPDMPDIARIDEDGLLTAVETVVEDEHVTDFAAGKIALDDNHDMRQRLKNYRWDVRRGHFIPLSLEPLAEAERETPELVDGIVEAIEHIYEAIGKKQHEPPARTKRAIEKFRRVVPRRKPQTIAVSSERGGSRGKSPQQSAGGT